MIPSNCHCNVFIVYGLFNLFRYLLTKFKKSKKQKFKGNNYKIETKAAHTFCDTFPETSRFFNICPL